MVKSDCVSKEAFLHLYWSVCGLILSLVSAFALWSFVEVDVLWAMVLLASVLLVGVVMVLLNLILGMIAIVEGPDD